MQLITLLVSIAVTILGALLSIIAYLLKRQLTNYDNMSKAVINIEKMVAVSQERFSGFERSCNEKHRVIEDKQQAIEETVKDHGKRILNIEKTIK